MSNLMERLDNLRALIQEPEFLEGKGLSNEVNIRIFCYDPKEEMAVRHFTEKLMTDQSLNCHLIEYNLYKVFLSICDDKRITDRVAQQEEKKGKQFVLDQMKRMANNTAFIGKMQYELQEVEEFFKTRVTLFDAAVQYEKDLSVDRDYIAKDDEAHQALNQIRLITMMPTGGKFRYDRIPELNDLMAKVKASHGKMLDAKREELLEIVRQCMEEIHTLAGDNGAARNISNTADNYFTQKKQQIASYQTLALLDGLVPPIWQYKDDTVSRIEAVVNPPVKPQPPQPGPGPQPQPKKEVIKAIHRQAMFPAKTLKSEEEIDAYVEKIRTNMKQLTWMPIQR